MTRVPIYILYMLKALHRWKWGLQWCRFARTDTVDPFCIYKTEYFIFNTYTETFLIWLRMYSYKLNGSFMLYQLPYAGKSWFICWAIYKRWTLPLTVTCFFYFRCLWYSVVLHFHVLYLREAEHPPHNNPRREVVHRGEYRWEYGDVATKGRYLTPQKATSKALCFWVQFSVCFIRCESISQAHHIPIM